MASSPPLILCRNLYDTVQQYPSATLTPTSEVVGREARRVGTYRRGRQWWQPTGDGGGTGGNWIVVDLGVGVTERPDTCFVDRSHNLWGRSCGVGYSTNGTSWTDTHLRTVPALSGTAYVPGGNPDTGWVVTEEGALWMRFVQGVAYRYWRFVVPFASGFTPVVPGLVLGRSYPLTGYLSSFDDDASERKVATEESMTGVRATGPVYSWRVLDLSLSLIGATEYDAETRALRTLMFVRDVPAVIIPEPGDHPERAWMYKYEGTAWGMAKTKVYRSGRHRMREYLAKQGGY